MRTPLIAGNWKMNKTVPETVEFLNGLKSFEYPDNREVLVAPTFISLTTASDVLKDSKVLLSAQNMHFEDEGAFTGEVSPVMIKDICTHVIIGHSERRHIFNEQDDVLNKKVKAALENGLVPILCVGEKIEQRKEGRTNDIVNSQLMNGLEGVEDLSNVIIAYEPVWAIGTGETATPEQADEVHAFIRSQIAETYDDTAAVNIRILYGGSVKPENVKELMAKEDIDGVLVGGASLDLEKFKKLIMFDN